jgi:colanic acid/amylovoran biosynthesis glycosyltransferase
VVVSLRGDGQDLAVPDLDLVWRRGALLLFSHERALQRALERGCPEDRAEILEPPVPDLGGEPRQSRNGAPLRIVSAGPLLWEQGYEHSIHAVRLLLDRGVDCEYRIVGEGDHVEAVAFARHQLGLHDHVELVSPNSGERLARELGSADVFLDPAVVDSVRAGALAAAQARGIPYVATGGGRELPEGGGISVPRRDPRALADALATLAGDRDLRLRMGREGRRVARPATLADHGLRLERLYRRALAEGP